MMLLTTHFAPLTPDGLNFQSTTTCVLTLGRHLLLVPLQLPTHAATRLTQIRGRPFAVTISDWLSCLPDPAM